MLKNWVFGVLLSVCYVVPNHGFDVCEKQEFDYGSVAKNELNKYSGKKNFELKAIFRAVANEAYQKGLQKGLAKGYEDGIICAKSTSALVDFVCAVSSSKDSLELFYRNSAHLATDEAKLNSIQDIPDDILKLLNSNARWLYKYWLKFEASLEITMPPSTTSPPLPTQAWLEDLNEDIRDLFVTWHAIVTAKYDEELMPHVYQLRSKLNIFNEQNNKYFKEVDINLRFAAFMAINSKMMNDLYNRASSDMYNFAQENPNVCFNTILLDYLPGWNMTLEQIEFLNIIRDCSSNQKPLKVLHLKTNNDENVILPYDLSENCDKAIIEEYATPDPTYHIFFSKHDRSFQNFLELWTRKRN